MARLSMLPQTLRPMARRRRRGALWVIAPIALGAVVLGVWASLGGKASLEAPGVQPIAQHHQGPPWIYGAADARFTLVLYADIECPFCKAYFPWLRGWIDTHPEVQLQWQHLPLAMHEPAATALASVAECAGETEGPSGFFVVVDWLYRNTRSDGQGLAAGVAYPAMTPAMHVCMEGGHGQAVVQAQAEAGKRDGVAATPTVRVMDRKTGRSILLAGPVEGDALLSALDLLVWHEVGILPVATENAVPSAGVAEGPRESTPAE